MILLVFLIKN